MAVLTPVYNGAATIARAVRSALAEPEVSEILVVDDGSTDGSGDVAAQCDDGTGRLTVVRQENRGPSAAYNRAFDASKAEFVCCLDADDFFLPGRLEAVFRLAGDDWDLVADKLLLAEEGSEAGPYERWRGGDGLAQVLDFETFVLGNITNARRPRTELGYLQPIMTRAFLDRHRLRHNENIRVGEDFLLYSTALALGARFRVVDHLGYVVVVRANSLSHVHSAGDLRRLLAAERCLAKLPLAANDRKALRRHARHTQNKYLYRTALDAKQRGDGALVLRTALSDWHAFSYMLSETWRAKTGSARSMALAVPPTSERSPIRT